MQYANEAFAILLPLVTKDLIKRGEVRPLTGRRGQQPRAPAAKQDRDPPLQRLSAALLASPSPP